MRGSRADLLAVGWLCLTWLVVFPSGVPGGLRAVVVLPAVLILPGYALLGALFPTADELTAVERVALSVAASVAVGILLGTGLLVSVGLTTATALLGVSAVVGGGVLLARYRRPKTGGERRDRRLLALGAVRDAGPTSGFGAAVAGLVVVAALAGAGGTAVLAVHEQPGYTELAVLPPDDDSIAAADYREAVAADRPLRVRVTNHYRRQVRYTVAVHAERITGGEVATTRHLDRFTVAVAPGETTTVQDRSTPPWSNNTRLVYRLYRVEGGGEHRVADAHVWLNATATGSATASPLPEAVA